MWKRNGGSGKRDPSPFRPWSRHQFPPPPECPGGFIYTVQRGDTMFRIARRFGVSLQALLNANKQVVNPNRIFPGQQLCIPAQAAPPCPGGFIWVVRSGETLSEIARRFGVTLQEIIRANPQITDPDLIFPGQRICVPTLPPPPECPDGRIVTVQQGDTLFRIAQRFGISLQALIDANPQITDPDVIFPGQRICVPGIAAEPDLPPPPACPGGKIITVERGDTLFRIAQRFGISLQALIDANPQITDPDVIFPGQRICVPGVAREPEIPPPPPCPDGFLFTVRKGDTLAGIARQFGISLQALIDANPQIKDPDVIFPGQVICVPTPPPPPECKDGFLFTVRKGDTLAGIACQFGISLQALIDANPQIKDPDVIFPGQVICVPVPPPDPADPMRASR